MATRSALRIDGLKVAKARLALPLENGKTISQFKLAERAGLHYVTVSNIERGAAANVTLETIGRLAHALGVEVAALLADDEKAGSDEDEEAASMASELLRVVRALIRSELQDKQASALTFPGVAPRPS